MLDKKKGQAAMEYLMTYGWAILAVVIVGGIIIAYVGPENLMGRTPTQGCPANQLAVESQGWSYNSSGTFDVIVKNNANAEVNITSVEVSALGGSNSTNVAEVVPSCQKSNTTEVTGLGTADAGDSVEPTVTFNYDVTDGLTGKASTCELSGQVS